jgi:DNA-binding SARP family transcriptional activator
MRIRCLGVFTLEVDSVAHVLRPSKRVSLLALLILNSGHAVPATRLMEEIWGQSYPDTASNALQAQIARLRANFREWRCDGDLTLRPLFPGYELSIGSAALDIHEFDTLIRQARALRATQPHRFVDLARQALGLWRGTAFAGMTLGPAGEGVKARLEGDRLSLLLDTIDAELDLGRERQLIPTLQELAQNQPLCERSYGQLMTALYRAGRSGDALHVYDDARRTFGNELGVEPSPFLTQLFMRILHHDPDLWNFHALSPVRQATAV